MASVQDGKEKAGVPEGKKKGQKQEKNKEKQSNAKEVVALQSDVESDAAFVIDEPEKGTPKQSAGTEQTVQSASANRSATPMAMGGDGDGANTYGSRTSRGE